MFKKMFDMVCSDQIKVSI